MKKDRNKCVLCDDELHGVLEFKLPCFMGVVKDTSNAEDFELSLTQCQGCGEIQTKELFDPNIIYQNNHNINTVGEIWKNHYIEFAEFIKKDIINKSILEISDPSAKIAKLSINFESWDIIEPNPENIKIKNVKFIQGFFDENFKTQKKDIIIHSHLLEHMYEPISFLKQCHNILNEDGMMLFSIPDMDFLLNEGYSPGNILHFEHTYFINKEVVHHLARKAGFEVIEFFFYKNHSVFFKLKKITVPTANIKPIKLELDNKFANNFTHHISNIKSINKITKDSTDEIYLFGAHVSSQFYISNGLDVSKISAIIDNAQSKSNKFLFGTTLQVKQPEILANKKCIVICSHVGIYFDEIVTKLRSINHSINII